MILTLLILYSLNFELQALLNTMKIAERFMENSVKLSSQIPNLYNLSNSIDISFFDSPDLFCNQGNLFFTESEDQFIYQFESNNTDWYFDDTFGADSNYLTILVDDIFFMIATNISSPFLMIRSNFYTTNTTWSQTIERQDYLVFVTLTQQNLFSEYSLLFLKNNSNIHFSLSNKTESSCIMNQINVNGYNQGDTICYSYFATLSNQLNYFDILNFIDSTIKILNNCSLVCEICSQNNGCLQCYSQYNKVLDQGVCVCSNGYFDDNDYCKKCGSQCESCINSQDQCTSCFLSQYRELNNNSCQCQQGYYEINSDICAVCSSICMSCFQIDTLCLSCYDFQFRDLVDGNCQCLLGYFEIQGQDQCEQCMVDCQQCKFVSTFCTQCYSSSNRILVNNSCVCNIGYDEIMGLCTESGTINQNALNPLLKTQSFCQDLNCKICYNSTICKNCMDGYFQQRQTCVKCSDDCLTCNNSKTCIQCKLGFNNSTGLCFKFLDRNMSQIYGKYLAICGDGMIFRETEECDDHNQQDGDGCSKYCKIEKLTVQLEMFFTPNNNKLNQPSRKLQINYNEDIKEINHTFVISDRQLQNSVNLENYYLDKINSRQSILLFTLEESSINQILIVQSSITNEYYLSSNISKIPIPDYSQPTKSQVTIAQVTKGSSTFLIVVILILSLLSILLGGIKMLFGLLELLQNFSYIYFINIQMPYMIEQIFLYLSSFNLNFIAIKIEEYFNILKYIEYIPQETVPTKFENLGYQSSFLINIIFFLGQLCLSIQTFLIFWCYRYIYQKSGIFKNHWVGIQIHKISQNVCRNFFFNQIGYIIFSMSIDLNICAFLEIRNLFQNKHNLYQYFSAYSALFCVLSQIFFLYRVSLLMPIKVIPTMNISYNSKNLQFLIENVKLNTQKNRLFVVSNLLNDIIFPLALVLLYDRPIIQTLILFINSLAKLLRHSTQLIFNSKLENIRYFALTLTTCLTYFVFIFFAIDQERQKNSLISAQQETYLSIALLGFWLTAISTYCICDSYEHFMFYLNWMKQKKIKTIKELYQLVQLRFDQQQQVSEDLTSNKVFPKKKVEVKAFQTQILMQN